MIKLRIFGLMIFLGLGTTIGQAQDKSIISSTNYGALELRNVSTGFASGRIADIAIHPHNENVWYVAVGSGGVWKTVNAGITWTPIFDDQPSYSIGSVTIDPSNPHIVWVGTGENVGGRHVGFGDGVYKSEDGGMSWKNMGLEASEHISKVVVHPENSEVVWVAAQGPLWNSGGERGLYKSTDGGESWTKTLGDDEWVGVTDLVLDPRNADVMYAATWQRHRTVAAYMGGGPGSGLHKSTDGGNTWMPLKKGIPGSNLGKIGLAISPQNPDIVYAAIELDRTNGGLFMSDDRGASWKKMSDMVSGGTGPHYYQELYASPHHFGRIYLMNVRTIVSNDHGKTYSNLPERDKHSDNHALAFRADDPDYLLMGSDGGVYETFDHGDNWRYMPNLPLTQYYKVAVDDEAPFYNMYGGTQDNGTHEGPSRTDLSHGIRTTDWKHILFADGHDTATEPGNPNIVYGETQQGGLHRIDRVSGERTFIQPQPLEGEDFERYNWDAPILISPHSPTRVYFASHRVWRSDDRGDSWTPISGDLTRDQERITLPIMGRQQSWDNAWDVNAMSNYNTISSLGESPLVEGLIYAGTDDGIIQVTEDGGENWTRIEVGSIRGIPETAFVNDVRADLHDPNTVYAALDNHKYGDFTPYLIKSTNRGRSWTSIAGNIPDRHLVWRMVQDHVNPNLLFAATEFGIFFTVDGGNEWVELDGGAPTIAYRDITIQRQHDDLVAASFGRGFFVLDDISPLRSVSESALNQEAALISARDAFWYLPRSVEIDPGASFYTAENPDFGAMFTYYLKDGLSSKKADRIKAEKAIGEEEDIPFPGWDALEEEMRETAPYIRITIKDINGQVVQRVKGSARKGMNRANWDLRLPSKNVIELGRSGGGGGWFGGGFMAVPGTYTATLSKVENGMVTELSEPMEFDVVPLREGTLEGAEYDEMVAFQNDVIELQQEITAFENTVEEHIDRIKAMQTAYSRADQEDADLEQRLHQTHMDLLNFMEKMEGSEAKDEIGERNPPTPSDRMFVGMRAMMTSLYGPTGMHKQMIEIGNAEFDAMKGGLNAIANRFAQFERQLTMIGAPPIED
jgi:photosystem II stability/assembly factor-like uncharacterized protein